MKVGDLVKYISTGEVAGMKGVVVKTLPQATMAGPYATVFFVNAPKWKNRTICQKYLEVLNESR
tara:strand:- start:462 stop:653 length:192 start_codon:yes stop_codon:yes gene_type:complete